MTDQAELPPIANIEAEAALLGAMMVDARVIDRIQDIVSADDFYDPLLSRMFTAITAQHAQGVKPSPVTLIPVFKDDPAMIALGGPGWMAGLTGNGLALIGANDFARQVKELADRRRLVAAAERIIDAARDCSETTTPEAVHALAEEELAKARGDTGSAHIRSAGDVADTIAAEMGKPVAGVTTRRIPDANKALGKLRPGDLVIIAGRPGMGKTAFASSYCIGSAEDGEGILFISAEMSDGQLVARMMSDVSYNHETGMGVPHWMVRDRHIPVDDDNTWALFERSRKRLHELPLRIVEVAGVTVPRIGAIARQTARRFEANGQKLGLIVVDYLQLLLSTRRDGNRVAEVSEISRDLKLLAKTMQVPIMALSQLSRAVEARDDKRPRMSDLRESGSIEQDADTIGFLYRHEYYLDMNEPEEGRPERATWEEQKEASRNVVELICAKARHGKTGTQEMRFYGEFSAMRGRGR